MLAALHFTVARSLLSKTILFALSFCDNFPMPVSFRIFRALSWVVSRDFQRYWWYWNERVWVFAYCIL